MRRRLKVLVSAYACSPYQGSEPGVGWGFVSELARHHDLWVIVEEEKFRTDIERYLVENPKLAGAVRFFFIRKQRNRALRKIWPPSYYWYYNRWHQQAFELAKRLNEEIQFDVAHQLTMVGFREPGYLWQLEVPFVWGPVGGMGYLPWRYLPQLGLRGFVHFLGYNVFNGAQMRWLRRPKLAAARAGEGLLAATLDNQAGIRARWHCESTLVAEVGLPPQVAQQPSTRSADEPLRVVWVGQLNPSKALNLGLHALAQVESGVSWSLDVIGAGPRAEAWQQLSRTLGIDGNCSFHGRLPRNRTLEMIRSSHVMLITSLRDLTSTVTVEALASGVPIVCLDHCGFGGVVDETCGIKVPVGPPFVTVAGLGRALATLAGDEALRYRLSEGAVNRADRFSWQRKVEVLNQIYLAKIGEKEQR